MKRFFALFLILLLLLPAGCKQQNTEPAASGTVVDNQAPDAPEQDVPEVVQPEENATTEEESSHLMDYYICQYFVTIKDEYVSQNYTEANFPEMDITDFSVKTYKYPDGAAEPCAKDIVLTTEAGDWDVVMTTYGKMKNRDDIHTPLLSYDAYHVSTQSKETLPSLRREDTRFEDGTLDGALLITLKKGVSPSPSMFQELKPEGISGEYYDDLDESGGCYIVTLCLKERGMDSLEKIKSKVSAWSFVEKVEYKNDTGSAAFKGIKR